MKNPTVSILAAARALRAEGTPQKAILAIGWDVDGNRVEATEENTLSYSQFWLYCARQDLLENTPELDLADLKAEELGSAIVERRNAGTSWGEIAVQADLPESRCRKIFEEATGVKSKGLRIGQGGRFLTDDNIFYMDDAKVSGTAIPVDKTVHEAKENLYGEIMKAREARAKKEAAKEKAAKTRAAKKAAKQNA